MDRREKQQKFHQAIIDMLYPPPTQHRQQGEEQEHPTRITSFIDLNHIKDPEFDSPSSSSDDRDEDEKPGGPHKLTRAQRKKLRTKKLKESASSSLRREIIGPLLPSAVNNPGGDNVSVGEHHPEGVRQNDTENQSQSTSLAPEDCNVPKEGKLKRRRMAKKLARENMRPSHHLDECNKDGDSARE